MRVAERFFQEEGFVVRALCLLATVLGVGIGLGFLLRAL